MKKRLSLSAFKARLSATKAYLNALSCLLTPKQQAGDHERAVFCVFFRPEVPTRRVLFSMNYLYKTNQGKAISAVHKRQGPLLLKSGPLLSCEHPEVKVLQNLWCKDTQSGARLQAYLHILTPIKSKVGKAHGDSKLSQHRVPHCMLGSTLLESQELQTILSDEQQFAVFRQRP